MDVKDGYKKNLLIGQTRGYRSVIGLVDTLITTLDETYKALRRENERSDSDDGDD